MSDTKINVKEENRRRRRINKIKKIIICMVIVCITVPTALSAMLMVKVALLEKEIKQLRAMEPTVITVVKDAVAESNVTDVVLGKEKETTSNTNKYDPLDATEIKDGIRKVYLTFDDGPSDNTDEILDILAHYNVKATFFVVAKNDVGSTRLYNRILNEGHTLAMHSYTHVYNQVYASLDSYKNDVLQLQNFIEKETGYRPMLYRFPGGSSNTVMNINIQDCIQFLDEEGITFFDWNVSSGDATGNGYPANVIADNVLTGIKEFENSIVLLHDASSKDATVESLPIIIEKLLSMDDVMILPLTETTELVQHAKRQ